MVIKKSYGIKELQKIGELEMNIDDMIMPLAKSLILTGIGLMILGVYMIFGIYVTLGIGLMILGGYFFFEE